MQQLLLLRHAKSSWDDPGQSDHARPLNARGRHTAGRMRDVLRELNIVPDVVLVSSARRTRQTLEALEPWETRPIIEPLDGLYLADAARIRDIVRGVTGTVRSLLVVGHNPGLHDFSLMLTGEAAPDTQMGQRLMEGFPAGALAEFTVPRGWGELGQGGARLVRFICPRDLAEAAS